MMLVRVQILKIRPRSKLYEYAVEEKSFKEEVRKPNWKELKCYSRRQKQEDDNNDLLLLIQTGDAATIWKDNQRS